MKKVFFSIAFIAITSLVVKAQMVLDTKQYFNLKGTTNFQGLPFQSIFIVPTEFDLILMDICINGYFGSYDLYNDDIPVITTEKAIWFHSCIGIVFKSGSHIKIRNVDSMNMDVKYHLIGYYIKK